MKIEFRPAGSGPYTVLADESVATLSASITGFQPRLAMSPQKEPGFGAAGVAVFDHGNQDWSLTFGVERVHASPDAALAFLTTDPATVCTLGNLDLKITVGAQVTYFVACAVTQYEPNPHSDQSTFVRYAFTGGSYTTTEP